MIIYLNGEYLPIEEAKVSVMDRGFQLADGVYDAFALYNGKPWHAQSHLDRLRRSLSRIEIDLPMTDAEILGIASELCKLNEPAEQQQFYIQVTRGVAEKRKHHYDSAYRPTVFAKIATVIMKDLHLGIKAITVDDIRWGHCDIKGINRLANVILSQQAHRAEAEEALIIRNNEVQEGASSNVFIVEKETVVTPPLSETLLPGITREIVIKLCQSVANLSEEAITRERLLAADEVWITSSSRGIAPVTVVDDQPIGQGQPGAIYQKAAAAYNQAIQELVSNG